MATDYYDGWTEGFTECAACLKAYWFRMLDWDDWQNVRVFSLSPIPARSMSELEKADPKAFVLPQRHLTLNPEASKIADAFMAAAQPPEFVFAADNLQVEIIAWRQVGSGSTADWFHEFGIDRQKRGG